MRSPEVVIRTRGATVSASPGDAPRAAAMRCCIMRDWVCASFEARVPMRMGGCLSIGGGLPRPGGPEQGG